jgi:hypothetical protein
MSILLGRGAELDRIGGCRIEGGGEVTPNRLEDDGTGCVCGLLLRLVFAVGLPVL